MTKAFEFENDGRTYTCRVESVRGPGSPAWWWFGVSGDGHRYAPFQAARGDTEDSVRTRIVAYYTNHLTRRSEPSSHGHWSSRRKEA